MTLRTSVRHAAARVALVACCSLATFTLSLASDVTVLEPSSAARAIGTDMTPPLLPALTSSVTALDFGDVTVGQRETRTLVLTHSGHDEQAIDIVSLYLNEPDARVFSVPFEGPVALRAGESVSLEVSYQPFQRGENVGALYVSHSGASGLEVFTLSGQGIDSSADESAFQGFALRNAPAIGFGKSLLQGIGTLKPTSLQFGPDGRLYAADMLGTIKAYGVKRNGNNQYVVTSTEVINLVKNIPNHNDNGAENSAVKNRLVTGIVVAGTANAPIVFVASSDPRIGGGPSHTDTNLDTNSGVVSRLYKQNGVWQRQDLVRGLPRSEENHHGNGMVYDATQQKLYLSQGGNTNAGATSSNFAGLPEYALSAAILEIDLQAIGSQTYDLPTLNDPQRAGSNDNNDPFGGNDGKNQARLVPGGPVQVYAPGFRNAYDLVVTEAGEMYTVDNGGNAGWGGIPLQAGPAGNCSNALNEPGTTHVDALHHINGRGYYGGHPNPTRGNKSNIFAGQSPIAVANPIECVFRGAGTAASTALATVGASTNGLTEYTAYNFGGAMRGDLLAAAFNNKIIRFQLNQAGTAVTAQSALFNNVGKVPLDIVAQAPGQPFPGTLWVADYVDKKIVVFEPSDYLAHVNDNPASGGAEDDSGSGESDAEDGSPADDDPSGGSSGNSGSDPENVDDYGCGATVANDDSDNDGYSNADELANGTSPCSAADTPDDADEDGVSDLNDNDDDNDGIADASDPFAIDPDNGRTTALPVSYTWENNSAPAGGLFNMGFTGLMTNGVSDWHQLFDENTITAGGAAGVFTLDSIGKGDPNGSRNNLREGFQFGVDITPSSPRVTVHTRIALPLAGASFKPWQSLGLQIGQGDQDNYIKWVVSAAGSESGGLQLAREVNGQFQSLALVGASIKGADSIDLMLELDPANGHVRAAYRLRRGGQFADWQILAKQTTLPVSWLQQPTAMAVGLIATSTGSTPFTGTWDFMEVRPGAIPGSQTNESDGSNTESGTGADSNSDYSDATGTGNEDGGNDSNSAVGWVVEAEQAAVNSPAGSHRWITVSSTGARGGQAMLTTPDSGKLSAGSTGSPHLTYPVNFPAAGTYHLWVRGKGDTGSNGEGKSDSVHVGLDGQLGSASAITGFPSQWTWSRRRHRSTALAVLVVPTAGSHTVDVWMREDGLMIDALAFSRDPAFNPDTGMSNSTDGTPGDTTGDAGGGSTDNGSGDDASTGGEADGGNTGDSASGEPVSVAAMNNGRGSLEAEHWQSNTAASGHQWVAIADTAASGGRAVAATPDNGKLFPGKAGAPALTWRMHFDAPGSYRVWLRGLGDTNASGEGKSDSVHVGINGQLQQATAMDRFPTNWQWRSSKRGGGIPLVQVPSSGVHTINVWMREDGLKLDKIVLVSLNSSYVPSGLGDPVQAWQGSDTGGSDGGGDPNPGGDTDDGADGTQSVSATAQWRSASLNGSARPDARHEAGGVAFNGKFYILGGRGNRPVSVFDPATRQWQNKRLPPESLHHFQPVVWGNRIWVIGSMTCCYPREGNNARIYTYNPANDTWQVVGQIPSQRLRASMGAAVHNGKIYLVGGNTRGHDGGAVNWFDEYNPATGQWRSLPNAPHARDHMHVAVIEGKLVVAAGRRSAQPGVFGRTESAVDIYDFSTGRWQQGRTIPTPRAGAMAVPVGGELVVIGGESGAQGAAHATVESYDLSRNTWRTLKPLQQGRHSGGAAVLNQAIHVAVGNRTRGGGDELNSHEVLLLD